MAALLLLLVCLALPAALKPQTQAPAANDDPPPFTIAVLRRDGIVNPFAAFDGHQWTAPWPAELRSMELPISVAGIPPKWWGKAGSPAEMTAWIDGVNRGPIHLLRPMVLRVMCESRLTLVSDYRSDQTAATSLLPPYPKDGLAVSGNQRVERIEIMSSESPEWAATAAFLAEEFDRSEHEAISAFTDWEDPISRSFRRKMPVEIEAMYRAPMDERGWTAYYIEAVKRYPPGPEDNGCGLITSAGGWMAEGPDGKRTVKLNSHVTYCDRRGVTYMLPLGLLSARSRSYWAFQLSGYGREGYLVVRPTPKRLEVQVSYAAGNCPLR